MVRRRLQQNNKKLTQILQNHSRKRSLQETYRDPQTQDLLDTANTLDLRLSENTATVTVRMTDDITAVPPTMVSTYNTIANPKKNPKLV